MDNIRIDDSNNAVLNYKKTGERILRESRELLHKVNVPIPVGESEPKKTEQSPVGLCVEHTDENNNTNNTDNKNTGKTNINNDYNQRKFSDSSNAINETYKNITKKRVLTNNEPSIDEMSDALEDIDNVCKAHIKDLSKPLPDNGVFTGSTTFIVENSNNATNKTFNINVNNSWQNKKKTFGIVANGTFDVENNKDHNPKNNLDNIIADNANDLGLSKEELEKINTDKKKELLNQPLDGTNYSANISVNTRLNVVEDFSFGAGVSSIFYNQEGQIHDINVTTIHKPTKIGADLMRRTIIVKDPITGEHISKSKMKLKLDLISNDPDNPFSEEETSKLDEMVLPSESNQDIIDAKNDSEKIKKSKPKDGSGLDVDFEYDNNKCGFLAEYGIHIINNKKSHARLTLTPAAGIYSYSSDKENSSESAKITFGGSVEFAKKWADGQTIQSDVTFINNRIVQKGSSPSDTFYTLLNANYNNPKAKLTADINGGYVKSHDSSIAFIEGRAGYQVKDFNFGVKGSYSYTDASGFNTKGTQFGASVIYNVRYGSNKKHK